LPILLGFLPCDSWLLPVFWLYLRLFWHFGASGGAVALPVPLKRCCTGLFLRREAF